MEDLEKENSLDDDFEVPSDVRGPCGSQGPTSIRSEPVFVDDAGPISYEDFGHGIDKRHARR